jgi:cytosine/adenosine deaminase-related metal-dependent hydrolase
MKPVIHKARWVMAEPGHWIENGLVITEENRILDVRAAVSPNTFGSPVMDHGPGILMPALVNAHTHVALSDSARPHASEGFIRWVECLIRDRNRQTRKESENTVLNAVAALKSCGTGLVGEFGPHIPVAGTFETAGLYATIWTEVLGNDRELPSLPANQNTIRHAWAAHAPHTTSPLLLKRVQETNARLDRRFCLHLAESREELKFLRSGKGAWADFMTRMGIDFSAWNCFGKRPVETALETGLLNENTLAVHLLEITSQEIAALAQSGAQTCLCPRSNWLLHRKLPNIEGFLKAGIRPAIGTDSLASTPTLSLFDEMRFVHDHFPNLAPDVILGMGTVNGARAMGYPNMGSLRPGNQSPMIYVELNAKNAKTAAEALVSTEDLVLSLIF